MRRSFELLVFFFLHQDLGHLIILEEVGREIKMGEIGVWSGCRDVEASVPSDKGIWVLRLVVARVDSDGGSNLLPVQRRDAT
jgi:hypothetical protein